MELRPARADEVEAFSVAVLTAFHEELTDEERERYARIHEHDRSLAWFDEGAIVATSSLFTRRLTVPGAAVDVGAVTAVAVLPTHRRRGLLTAMMRRLLDNVRDAGEPVAALWASEGAIYGRFGFGVAAQAAELRTRRPATRLASPPQDGGALRSGPAAEHVAAMRAVHARVVPTRPGMLTRSGPWWDERLHDPESEREGAHALRAVVAGDAYALYAVRRRWDADGPAGEVVVRELVAASPEGHAAIWAYLLDLDLTRTLSWELAPADEPLWLTVTDPRAVRRTLADSLWVRLVDVPAALAARGYAADPDVVLEVRDAFCPWNEGRYRLADGDCAPTAAAPDLVLDAAALGAAYLGGTLLTELAAARRVQERTPGSLARASAAFRGDVAPWCPEIF